VGQPEFREPDGEGMDATARAQLAYSLAASLSSILRNDMRCRLEMNLKCFLQVARMHVRECDERSVSSSTHFVVPVSSGCRPDQAAVILRSPNPASERILSSPDTSRRIQGISDARASELLQSVDGEDTWPTTLKAQVRRMSHAGRRTEVFCVVVSAHTHTRQP